MNIGIIGAGAVGTGLAKRLIAKGHAPMLSFTRDVGKLRSLSASLGARAGSVPEAAEFGEVIVLATPWTAAADALTPLGGLSFRKILWDCTNALKPDMSGLAIGTTTSGGEEIARIAPWATVVKAIPPFAEVLHLPGMAIGGNRPSVFVCGDDREARIVVSRLVDDIGAAPVIAGPLRVARYTEPAAMLLVELAYAQGFGARIGVTFIHDDGKSS